MASLKISAVPEGLSIGLGILLFNFLIWLFRNFRGNNNRSELPPGPRPLPVLGNLHMLGSLLHRTFTNLAKKYGPIMFLRLGSVPTLVVSSPAMAKEFLKTHGLVFANRPDGAAAKLLCYDRRDVALAPYGGYWRQIKKLCTMELLTAKRIDSFKFVREEEISAMIPSFWKESERGSRCVDLSKTISSLTLNIVCRMFASRTYSDHELSGGHRFKTMLDELPAVTGAFDLGDFIPWLQRLDLQGIRRRMKKVHRVFDKFAENVIDEHMSSRRELSAEKRDQGGSVKDFVDVLLDLAEAKTEGTEMKITRTHIKAIILDVLAAGTETSSTTIVWAMSELLKNPRSLSRARKVLYNFSI